MMNELALYSGCGGGLLATQRLLGFKVVCYVEIDDYCIEVLRARIRDGLLDDAPIWDNVKTFDGSMWRGKVDLVTAGFPCTPWSIAGKQMGAEDDRNLWPDTIRVIREVRPKWCLLENVPGLLAGSHGYFGRILRDLAIFGIGIIAMPMSMTWKEMARNLNMAIAHRMVVYAMERMTSNEYELLCAYKALSDMSSFR